MATLWEQLCALPSNQVGEIVGGELHASPRPTPVQARVTSKLIAKLDGPFDSGVSGPGGWIQLREPELHLGGDVLVPDIAGWRRERMPFVPEELVAFELAPDWICEVLSGSSGGLDRGRKLPAYARERVRFAWVIEPVRRVLEVFELCGGEWLTVGAWEGAGKVRAVPFEAVELDLSGVWADIGQR